MKEDRFLDLSGEMPILSESEANQLKGGFKKVMTKSSVRMSSDDGNKNCYGSSGDRDTDEDQEDSNANCHFTCRCND